MVFVLLTYGGWSETVYLSGEARQVTDMSRALFLGTTAVTILYLFTNLAFVRAFGLEGLRQSNAVAADLVKLVAGDAAAKLIAGIVCIASLSTLNATIFTGARSIFAFGRSFAPFAMLGEQGAGDRAPRNALVVQAAITMGLIIFGAFTRDGFQSMVEYTAPVF